MSTSLFDIFSIGIGPSASHTVGPMRAAYRFVEKLKKEKLLSKVENIKIELYGSLALTGPGHATDKAVLLGLLGFQPENINPQTLPSFIEQIYQQKSLHLGGEKMVSFIPNQHLLFLRGKRLPFHANSLRLRAQNKFRRFLLNEIFYSIGGGFILSHQEALHPKQKSKETIPYPFTTCSELLEMAANEKKAIYQLMWENEKAWHSEEEISSRIDTIWKVMKNSIQRGCLRTESHLPGGLNVTRRAPLLYKKLLESSSPASSALFDWVALWAMAVNEENASLGQVIASPTNGASGIIPAVLSYYEKFIPSYSLKGVEIFFLTATAVCNLYKEKISIAGAEMGCQGEVGVSSSMAAAGLAAALGGSNEQVENAAEIAMEHHLGLTCDPVGGLVQIPCIERNTMGAIKAINATNLALRGDGTHLISLDQVIATMKQTGEDMKDIYKETSLGGLAKQLSVNVPSC